MNEIKVWEPIYFDEKWLKCDTSKFDDLAPSWYSKRKLLREDNEDYEEFIIRLKRHHAIETGIVEKLYDLSEGITETFIKEGFVESYIGHDDTNIHPQKLMAYLNDHFQAIDFVFDFVKKGNPLSKSFIKQLHALITKNQETSLAINSLGRRVQIELIKGEFKKADNNPKREDGTIFLYCPAIQVDSEIEKLIDIHSKLERGNVNPIILSAWFHHAFTQIHPFQDGNGRIGRLLASLILIKARLFPFTVKRDEKVKYIKALEYADNKQPDDLVSFFSNVQKRNIEQILNYKAEKAHANLKEIAQIFTQKVEVLNSQKRKKRQELLSKNRSEIFEFVYKLIGEIRKELVGIIPKEKATILLSSEGPDSPKYFWYTKQIADYASKHNYYFNKILPRGWFKFTFYISEDKRYVLVISIHHYSFEDNVLAIGSFLEFLNTETDEMSSYIENTTTIPINIEPYTISLEADVRRLKFNIENYIRDIVKIGLTIITNELV